MLTVNTKHEPALAQTLIQPHVRFTGDCRGHTLANALDGYMQHLRGGKAQGQPDEV